MHIKVHTSHRHFLAAPLAMGILLVSSFGGALTASLASPDANGAYESEFQSLPSHTEVLPLEGSNFQNGSLIEGSILVRTEGLAQIEAGDATVYGLNGGFHVVRYEDSVSASAITGPVLVEKNDVRVLIPTGWMWSGETLSTFDDDYNAWLAERTLRSIPDRFLKAQMQNLQSFADPVSVLPEIAELPKSHASPSLLLGDAKAREDARWNEEVLGALVGYIQGNDTVSARVVLEDDAYKSAFVSERGKEVLTILLSQVAGASSIDRSILDILSTDENLALLASVHPRTRASAWTLVSSDSVEDQLLRIMRFPFSDVQFEGASDFTVQRWEQSVLAKAKMMKDPVSFVESLIKEVSPLIELHYANAYPRRGQQLTVFLETLTETYRSLLSSQAKSTVLKLALLDRVEWNEPQDQEVVVEVAEQEESIDIEFNPAEVEQYAYEHLRDAGALFTVETTVKGVAPNVAEVRSVLFGGTTQDVTANFLYNVLTHEISDLVVNNTEYPNAIGIVKFGEWVRGL